MMMQPDQFKQEQPTAVAQPESNTQPINPLATEQPKKKLLLPILLMCAPLILVIASIILYAIVNFAFNVTQPQVQTVPGEADLYGDTDTPNPVRTILNVLLFLMGSISVMGIIPCFIIGLVLLTQRLKK